MFPPRRDESDFKAEIEAHLELEQEELREEGLTEERARAVANRRFGNTLLAQEAFHEGQHWLWWEHLRQDLKYAARALSCNPRFTVAAVLTLALGIGANTAIFSVVDTVLLRPLPLPESERLATVFSFNKKTERFVSTSYVDYLDFSQRSKSFRYLSAYVRMPLTLTIGEHSERISVEAVTTNYFSMLGLPAAAGRTFFAEDDTRAVAMIGEDLWEQRFKKDLGIVGKNITIEDQSFSVVGIVPRRYHGANLNWNDSPQIWIPLGASPSVLPHLRTVDIFRQRNMPWVLMIGRLRNEVSVAHAQAELQMLAARLNQADPTAKRDLTAVAFSANRSKLWPLYRSRVIQSLGMFAGAALLMFLLTCSTLSNLNFERTLSRRREIAIRLAIGSTRSRLIRQLLAESVLLGMVSFFAALLITQGVQRVLTNIPRAFGADLTLNLGIDGHTLAFCCLLSFATVLLFSLFPALQATRPGMLSSLKESGNACSPLKSDWLQHSLVVLQVAFSMILLVGCGLFGRSLLKANSIDLGFQRDKLLTLSFDSVKHENVEGEHLRVNLMSQAASMPGVKAATTAFSPPLHPVGMVTHVRRNDGAPIPVDYNIVGPDFLTIMGITRVAGRDFASSDDSSSARVGIVNQKLAKLLWHDSNPVGQTIRLQEKQGKSAAVEIIGVAQDSRYSSVWDEPAPYLYLAALQSRIPTGHLIVRTYEELDDPVAVIRPQWDAMVPQSPLYEIRTLAEQVSLSLAPQRLAASIFGAFSLLATTLAALGLFSVIGCAVNQRRREIGIRIALGARPEVVVRAVLGRAILLTVVGLVIGAAACAGLAQLVAPQIRGVSPNDGITFMSATLLLTIVAIAAGLMPAISASRIDPVKVLRCD